MSWSTSGHYYRPDYDVRPHNYFFQIVYAGNFDIEDSDEFADMLEGLLSDRANFKDFRQWAGVDYNPVSFKELNYIATDGIDVTSLSEIEPYVKTMLWLSEKIPGTYFLWRKVWIDTKTDTGSYITETLIA